MKCKYLKQQGDSLYKSATCVANRVYAIPLLNHWKYLRAETQINNNSSACLSINVVSPLAAEIFSFENQYDRIKNVLNCYVMVTDVFQIDIIYLKIHSYINHTQSYIIDFFLKMSLKLDFFLHMRDSCCAKLQESVVNHSTQSAKNPS